MKRHYNPKSTGLDILGNRMYIRIVWKILVSNGVVV